MWIEGIGLPIEKIVRALLRLWTKRKEPLGAPLVI